jgi:hypothetical protein
MMNLSLRYGIYSVESLMDMEPDGSFSSRMHSGVCLSLRWKAVMREGGGISL